MAQSSILGGQAAPRQARGRDADLLGPSDTSDSGSDIQGEAAFSTASDSDGLMGTVPMPHGTDTDSSGTGERASAVPERIAEAADIGTDRIERSALSGHVSLNDPDALATDELLLEEDDETEDESSDEEIDD